MITINGKKYAKNEKEFIGTLFEQGGTASGYYSKKSNGILLKDAHRAPFAFIAKNKHGEVFAVSACTFEGKTRYMYGASEKTKTILGLDSVKYQDQKQYLLAVTTEY